MERREQDEVAQFLHSDLHSQGDNATGFRVDSRSALHAFGTHSLRIHVEHEEHGRVQRRITIHGDDAAHAVQQLIDSWREEREIAASEAEVRREQERAYEYKLHELRSTSTQSAGGRHRGRSIYSRPSYRWRPDPRVDLFPSR